MIASVCLLLLAVLLQSQPQPTPATPAAAGPGMTAPPSEDPVLIRRLEVIDAYAAGITDLTATFDQRRHTALLRKPLVSSGRVRLKGSVIRWDTAAPGASVLVIDATSLRILYPEQRALEIYPMESGLSRLASTPLPRLKVIREQFVIRECKPSEMDGGLAAGTTAALAIVLTPTGEDLKKYVREVRVLLDEPPPGEPGNEKQGENRPREGRDHRPYGVARQVEVTDADGDRTIVVFTDIQVNIGLQDSELALVVPDGTRISRPLEGAAGGTTERKEQK